MRYEDQNHPASATQTVLGNRSCGAIFSFLNLSPILGENALGGPVEFA
jgi:hypothetical protein